MKIKCAAAAAAAIFDCFFVNILYNFMSCQFGMTEMRNTKGFNDD